MKRWRLNSGVGDVAKAHWPLSVHHALEVKRGLELSVLAIKLGRILHHRARGKSRANPVRGIGALGRSRAVEQDDSQNKNKESSQRTPTHNLAGQPRPMITHVVVNITLTCCSRDGQPVLAAFTWLRYGFFAKAAQFASAG